MNQTEQKLIRKQPIVEKCRDCGWLVYLSEGYRHMGALFCDRKCAEAYHYYVFGAETPFVPPPPLNHPFPQPTINFFLFIGFNNRNTFPNRTTQFIL